MGKNGNERRRKKYVQSLDVNDQLSVEIPHPGCSRQIRAHFPMDPATVATQSLALVAAGVAGWQLRSGLEPEPSVCKCACACHCACELGFTSGLWILIFFLICGCLGLGVFLWDRLWNCPTQSPSPSKGRKGVFGSTGKLSLLG